MGRSAGNISIFILVVFFFFKQKTAYEIKECDWSSDVCSSDLTMSPWHVQPRLKEETVPSN